jgi:dTDP-4-dehydrorhamnose reductase
MKIIIFGGSGQLGKSLLDFSWGPQFTLISPSRAEVDILHFKEVQDYVASINPEYVINATAWTDVLGAESSEVKATALNVDAVANLASICSGLDITLIHISTDYVFDGLKGDTYVESDSANPQTSYGRTKHDGENKIIESGISKFYIIRTSWLYSKYGKNFVKTIVAKALQNEPASIVDDQFGSPTFAGDLAAGIASIAEVNPKYGIYHFSNLEKISWFDLGRAIYEEVGSDVDLVKSRKTDATELKRPVDSTLDTKKWHDSNLLLIPKWRDSLKREMPSIQKTVEREIRS